MDISDEIVFPIYDEMYLNHGKLEIKCTENGPNLIVVDDKVFAAMCRCAASNNKPYCDGAHANTAFKAEAKDKRSCVGSSFFISIFLEISICSSF